jgi:hypothetical protein
MPKESFVGELLREHAEIFGLEVEGLNDEQIREKCYDTLKDRDAVAALEYKFGKGWDGWSDEEFDEALSIMGPKKALTIALTRNRYFQKVEKIVQEKFPKFEGCYDDSFAVCLIAITNGVDKKMGSVLEQLACYHSEYDSKDELSVFGAGYTGDMLHLLHSTGIVKI